MELNIHWPYGSNGRFHDYRPWYRVLWGLVWVVPLYVAYGLLVCVATCAFCSAKEAIRWIGR